MIDGNLNVETADTIADVNTIAIIAKAQADGNTIANRNSSEDVNYGIFHL